MKHLNLSVAGDINSIIITAGTGNPLNFLYTFVHTHLHICIAMKFLPGFHSTAVLTEGRRGGEVEPCLPSVVMVWTEHTQIPWHAWLAPLGCGAAFRP